MLKKRLFSIACSITIATAMCAVTGCGSSQSSGASQQGAGKVDYSALPKIDMPDKKIVLLTQSEEKATTYKEHYGITPEIAAATMPMARDARLP